jgi:hypothetical protein
MNYTDFLDRKSQLGGRYGFEPLWMPGSLFDFQAALVEWALLKGRAAIFSDCGTGKSLMQLVWAENVIQKTNGKVLILTPLAVAAQTEAEGAKFGIECGVSRDGKVSPNVTITNYERLHHFNPADFAGVVCDESSAIKSFNGKHRAMVTDFLRKMPYRLLCTATAAPNDYIELGTSSEALGELGYMDMLNRFFKNDHNTSSNKRAWRTTAGGAPKWRFKGHAEDHFWRWVSSWARAMRRPSDLGFNDSRFILPELSEQEHLVKARTLAPGFLFEMPAFGLNEQREELRRTLNERCEKAVELVNHKRPAIIWCHLNAEGDALAKLIPDAVQVKGSDSVEVKEDRLIGFTRNQFRVLVIKPKIGAWGLNYQHCSDIVYFPSHSYEQYYQAVRRCWRFGQTRPVKVEIVTTESGHDVMENLQRKSTQADRMFSSLVAHMNEAVRIERGDYQVSDSIALPSWIKGGESYVN